MEDIEYGNVYASYVKDFFISKTPKTRILINLTDNVNLEKELCDHFIQYAQVPSSAKDIFIKGGGYIIVPIKVDDIESLIDVLQRYLDMVDNDTNFYIFGTNKFEHATYELHKFVKKINNKTVSIRHS